MHNAPEKLNVFLSYSRANLDFADQLLATLTVAGFKAVLDRHGIAGGEEWEKRIGDLITEADVIVFILSPASIGSDVCQWEVDEAIKLGKRILPVLCASLGDAAPPSTLTKLNYIYFYSDPNVPGSNFATGLGELVEALKVDTDWLREHTRIVSLARAWSQSSRPKHRLLQGVDIFATQGWAAARPDSAPPLTDLVKEFIAESEEADLENQRIEQEHLRQLADAQKAEIDALQEKKEAQDLEKIASAKVIRRTRIGLLAALTLVVGLAIAGVFAIQQRDLALQAQNNAELARDEAQSNFSTAISMASEIVNQTVPVLNKHAPSPKQVLNILKPVDQGLKALSETKAEGAPTLVKTIAEARLVYAKSHENEGNSKEAETLVGDALDRINEALEIHQSEKPLLVVRAKALAQLGEIKSTRGSLNIALSHFDEAQKIIATLVNSESDDLELLSLQADIIMRAGAAARRNDNFEEARKNYENAYSFFKAIITISENKVDAKLKASKALYEVATIYHENHDFDQAISHYESIRKTREKLSQAEPNNFQIKRLLAWALSIESEAYQEVGQFAKAQSLQNYMLEIRQQIYTNDPDHQVHVRDLAWAYFTIAERERLSGDYSSSLVHMKKALDIFHDLLFRDLENSENIRRVGWTLRHIGLMNTYLGNYDKAESALKEADEKLTLAIESAPDQLWWSTEHAMTLSDLGYLYEKIGDFKKAAKTYDTAQAIFAAIPERKLVRANRAEARRILAQRIKSLEIRR